MSSTSSIILNKDDFNNEYRQTKEILEDSIYDIFRTYGLMSAHNNDNISNDDFFEQTKLDLECLNIRLSFIEHPTKKAFNGIIRMLTKENYGNLYL